MAFLKGGMLRKSVLLVNCWLQIGEQQLGKKFIASGLENTFLLGSEEHINMIFESCEEMPDWVDVDLAKKALLSHNEHGFDLGFYFEKERRWVPISSTAIFKCGEKSLCFHWEKRVPTAPTTT